MGFIYRITSTAEAAEAARTGTFRSPDLTNEGFIHCSYAEQVAAVANRLFRGRTDLVLLEIDKKALACPVVDENLEGGAELYPHVYGHIPMTAVVTVLHLPCGDDGSFQFARRDSSR